MNSTSSETRIYAGTSGYPETYASMRYEKVTNFRTFIPLRDRLDAYSDLAMPVRIFDDVPFVPKKASAMECLIITIISTKSGNIPTTVKTAHNEYSDILSAATSNLGPYLADLPMPYFVVFICLEYFLPPKE